MKRRYQLGILDASAIAFTDTVVEDSPFIGITLDDEVDGVRLQAALDKTLELFPIFRTKAIFDKGYFLEENPNPAVVFHEDDHDRAFSWKVGTNGYLWKLCYYHSRITMSWCHAVTDGKGAIEFLGALLKIYYGVPCVAEPEADYAPGLEPFVDRAEKGLPQKKQGKGFGTKGIRVDTSNRSARCHVLKCKTKDLLTLAKRSDASPATVIPPLFSMALRACMEEKRDVRFRIVVDARAPLGHTTVHNCIFGKAITYIDRFDEMDFELVSTIYRAILQLAVERENVIAAVTNSVESIKKVVHGRSEALIRLRARLRARSIKTATSDATFSYVGRIDYGEEINSHIEDFSVAGWTDYGYCTIVAAECGGNFTMMINEAYQDNDVVPRFIRLAAEHGLEICEVSCYTRMRADR